MTAIPNGEVSASKFNTAFGRAGCGMKFYYRYIEGIRGPVNASLLAGIAFDKATTALHEAMIANPDPDARFDQPELPVDVFVDAWENPDQENRDGEPVEFDLSDAPVDILDRGISALSAYQKQAEGMRPLNTQVFVETSFDETDAKLIGFIDLVEAAETGVCISDVKSSLSPRKKWTHEDAARDTQLNLYALMYENQTGDAVNAVGWRHARLGGKVEVGATHVATQAPDSILQRVSFWMGELERWCETGLFPATGVTDRDAWVCSAKYCDYYHRCPHGAKAQTVVPLTIGKRVTAA